MMRIKAGAAAFFQKPVDNEELMNVIRISIPHEGNVQASMMS